ncbi:FAD-dependent oxidoreductase [Riemerella anatipestifer]|nr:FAD-dependent oxidoreductase [Riemerella anatipestifer]
MKNVEYIIVGDGYAGLFFAHQLLKNNHSFVLFSDGEKGASQVSAGIVNPVVLKKFTTFWKAKEQIDFLTYTMKEIEAYTSANYLIKAPIHRIFHDESERELWKKKRLEKEELKPFLSDDFSALENVENPFETGKVLKSSRLNVPLFFSGYLQYLEKQNKLIKEKFDYNQLSVENNKYKDWSYKKIVFAEGIGVKNNPFFRDIMVNPNKGHHLKVKLSKELYSDVTIKKKHFLFPLEETDVFYYGGTYDRDNTDEEIDTKAVEQLENGLKEFYPFDFEVKEICYGFRPTVKDRRPILGAHEQYSNLYVFNGLGARGILNGSYFSKVLYDFTLAKIELPEEVNHLRFSN